ncbi:hypothetical protein EI94DRAFT_1720488 [Lactarius quietus]|nr:hypothetical protein EI94DRAFT_1720488 [Lactarius quietus]
MLRSPKNEALLEERRTGLEAYLRAIVSAKDSKWLDTFALRDFLGVPPNNSSSSNAAGGEQFTSSSWLDEHMDLQARVRDVRADDDCEKLAKMLTVARHASRGLGSAAERSSPAADSDRAALFSGATLSKPIARVFGAPQPPKETEQTRPLDNQGLLQLQQVSMERQDTQLEQLTSILQRQKQLGIAINNELVQHMELLDGLSDDMDRVGGKLTAAKKQLNRLG